MSEHFHTSTAPVIPLFSTREGECVAGCGAKVTETQYAGKSWQHYTCESCEATIALRTATEAARQHRAVMLHTLDVPPLYEHVSLETFQLHGGGLDRDDQARVLQLARRYIGTWPDVPRVVVMQGPPGTGKGHLLWSIAKAVAGEHGERARVVKLADAIRDLRAAWSGGDGEMARLARYRLPRLLGIDEVSRHAFFGQPQQHLYDLIDYRDEQLRPTIITTNENAEGLSTLLGPALLSRCMGAGAVWKFGAADYRVHRGKEHTQENI